MENSFSEKRIEQEIGWNKVLFAVFAAIDVSLIAWFVENYNSAPAALLATTIAVIFFIAIELKLIHLRVLNSSSHYGFKIPSSY